MLLVSEHSWFQLETRINSVSLIQNTFDGSSNATTAILNSTFSAAISLLMISFWGWCLHNILSLKMKYNFRHNDRKKITPAAQ